MRAEMFTPTECDICKTQNLAAAERMLVRLARLVDDPPPSDRPILQRLCLEHTLELVTRASEFQASARS